MPVHGGTSRLVWLLWLPAMFAVVLVLVWAGTALEQPGDSIAPIWLANGFMLGVLLAAGACRWPALLAAFLLAQVTAICFAGHAMPVGFAFAADNVAEVLLAAWLLRRCCGEQPDLVQPKVLLGFALVGGVAAPAASALIGAALVTAHGGIPAVDARFLDVAQSWYVCHALGLAIMAPLVLTFVRRDLLLLFVRPLLNRTLLLLGGYAVIVVAVFAQSRLPLLFLAFPPLLLVVSQLGFAGTGLTILLTAVIAIGFTTLGHGPIMLVPGTLVPGMPASGHLEFAQMFLLVGSCTAYPIGAAVAGRRRLNQVVVDQHAKLSRSERLYRLLADNAGDIITRATLDGRQLYVSPSVEAVLGWPAEALMRHGWMQYMHEDDIEAFVAGRQRMREGLGQITDTSRIRRADERWAWMESRVSLVRDKSGRPRELIGIHRDVTRQKEAEQALENAMAELATQAATDGLTGIANRRSFDEMLQKEWRAAARAGSHLAVLMIDVDHFKAFNDRYGHQAGDDGLRAVAGGIVGNIRRPHDLAARYGGEEFAMILPGTPLEGARQVAMRLVAAVAALAVPHAGSPIGMLTISIGAACLVPGDDAPATDLLLAADTALYAAKRNGRNRVEVALPKERPTTVIAFPHAITRAIG